MSDEPILFQPACCESNCRRCPWRGGQPASKWCESCDATTYLDEQKQCLPCQCDFVPLKQIAAGYGIAMAGSDEEKQLLAVLVARIQGGS